MLELILNFDSIFLESYSIAASISPTLSQDPQIKRLRQANFPKWVPTQFPASGEKLNFSPESTKNLGGLSKLDFNFFLKDSGERTSSNTTDEKRKWNNYANGQQNKTHFINNQITGVRIRKWNKIFVNGGINCRAEEVGRLSPTSFLLASIKQKLSQGEKF